MNDAPFDPPFDNGTDRGVSGKFVPGNKAAVGRGNPLASEVGRHRAQFFAALRDSDVDAALKVIRRLMKDRNAKDADRLAAARELLDRVIGKSVASDLLARIESIEKLLEARNA